MSTPDEKNLATKSTIPKNSPDSCKKLSVNSIKKWPVEQRPQERLLSIGAIKLSDAELLALILRTGIPGQDVVHLAHNMLSQFGSIRGLLDAPQSEAFLTPGLGPAKWAKLQAGKELVRRSLQNELRSRDVLKSPAAVQSFLKLWLRNRAQEIFAVLFLDTCNRLICAEEIFQGTLNQTAVYPREICKRVLELNSSAIILAHNHPSGLAAPSTADENVTQILRTSLALIDVVVLDHIIIAGNTFFSFSEAGLM